MSEEKMFGDSDVFGKAWEEAKKQLREYWMGNIDESQLCSRVRVCRDIMERR